MVDDRTVGELRELERRDDELAATAGRLRSLDGEIASVRRRSEEIDAFFAGYPTAEARRREAVAAAQAELEQRERDLDAARRAFDQAKEGDERAAAERVLERARDHVSVAVERVARAAAAREELEREAGELPRELPPLAERAGAVAGELDGVGVPESAPRALIDWAGRAHASLFVALAQVNGQRDRLIREASELAAALLGDPVFGSTLGQIRARVEALRG